MWGTPRPSTDDDVAGPGLLQDDVTCVLDLEVRHVAGVVTIRDGSGDIVVEDAGDIVLEESGAGDVVIR